MTEQDGDFMNDIAVIGSGPAGLSAVLYAVRAGLDTVLIDTDFLGGSQASYSEKVDNYLGIPEINGFELMEKFREHLSGKPYKQIESAVVEIKKADNEFIITLENAEVIKSKTIIYAAGAFHRKLHIAGENELSGRGVSYCAVCDGDYFEGKKAVVVGGGDTAVDSAVYLSQICSEVYLVHRRKEFRANIVSLNKLRSLLNVTVMTDAVPVSINGEKSVESITLKNTVTEEETVIHTDSVFVSIGMVPKSSVISTLVEIDQSGYIAAGEDGVTSLPGFFAAGDVRTKPLRQVVTAVSDGAVCVSSVLDYISKNF